MIWRSAGPGGWYFASVPKDISKKIRNCCQDSEEGWGRLKAQAQIQNILWETAIWFDTKHDCYLLPIKAEIRKKLGLTDGSKTTISLSIPDHL